MPDPQNNENTDRVPPTKESTATPLFSAEQLDVEDYPLVDIQPERVDSIRLHADRLANNSYGTRENYVTGLMGEFAWARPLGLAEKLNTDVIPDGGDGGYDLCYRGATIDVKTVGRHRDALALTVDAYEPLQADFYALASRISETKVQLIGYTPREFVANAQVRFNDGEPYHYVNQEYIFPFPQAIF